MSSSSPLDDWLAAVVATHGLTALRDIGDARRVLLDDSLAGADLVARFDGAIVDVGSGGGAPGIPLAHTFPNREVVLLDAERRKCEFLESVAPANARVVWGRAEEQETDWAGVAVAKALARPATAAEWCLPLVRPGGIVVLWTGETADPQRVAAVAERLAAELVESHGGLLVIRKTGPTPPGFPRRVGVARKRPLA
jgi:16S rRNA (guanine527-N7)-methyltransferase